MPALESDSPCGIFLFSVGRIPPASELIGSSQKFVELSFRTTRSTTPSVGVVTVHIGETGLVFYLKYETILGAKAGPPNPFVLFFDGEERNRELLFHPFCSSMNKEE